MDHIDEVLQQAIQEAPPPPQPATAPDHIDEMLGLAAAEMKSQAPPAGEMVMNVATGTMEPAGPAQTLKPGESLAPPPLPPEQQAVLDRLPSVQMRNELSEELAARAASQRVFGSARLLVASGDELGLDRLREQIDQDPEVAKRVPAEQRSAFTRQVYEQAQKDFGSDRPAYDFAKGMATTGGVGTATIQELLDKPEEERAKILSYYSDLVSPRARGFVGGLTESAIRGGINSFDALRNAVVLYADKLPGGDVAKLNVERNDLERAMQGFNPDSPQFSARLAELGKVQKKLDEAVQGQQQVSSLMMQVTRLRQSLDPVEGRNIFEGVAFGVAGMAPDLAATAALNLIPYGGQVASAAYWGAKAAGEGNYELEQAGLDTKTRQKLLPFWGVANGILMSKLGGKLLPVGKLVGGAPPAEMTAKVLKGAMPYLSRFAKKAGIHQLENAGLLAGVSVTHLLTLAAAKEANPKADIDMVKAVEEEAVSYVKGLPTIMLLGAIGQIREGAGALSAEARRAKILSILEKGGVGRTERLKYYQGYVEAMQTGAKPPAIPQPTDLRDLALKAIIEKPEAAAEFAANPTRKSWEKLDLGRRSTSAEREALANLILAEKARPEMVSAKADILAREATAPAAQQAATARTEAAVAPTTPEAATGKETAVAGKIERPPEVDLTAPLDTMTPGQLKQYAESVRGRLKHERIDATSGVPTSNRIREKLVADPENRVFIFDIDHFKRFNDQHGHAAGDAVLGKVGELMRKFFPDQVAGERAGRFGGEEFVVILPKDGSMDAQAAAFLKAMPKEASFRAESGEVVPVTASGGIKSGVKTEGHAGKPTLAADALMYEAKAAGRNRLAVDKKGKTEYILGEGEGDARTVRPGEVGQAPGVPGEAPAPAPGKRPAAGGAVPQGVEGGARAEAPRGGEDVGVSGQPARLTADYLTEGRTVWVLKPKRLGKEQKPDRAVIVKLPEKPGDPYVLKSDINKRTYREFADNIKPLKQGIAQTDRAADLRALEKTGGPQAKADAKFTSANVIDLGEKLAFAGDERAAQIMRPAQEARAAGGKIAGEAESQAKRELLQEFGERFGVANWETVEGQAALAKHIRNELFKLDPVPGFLLKGLSEGRDDAIVLAGQKAPGLDPENREMLDAELALAKDKFVARLEKMRGDALRALAKKYGVRNPGSLAKLRERIAKKVTAEPVPETPAIVSPEPTGVPPQGEPVSPEVAGAVPGGMLVPGQPLPKERGPLQRTNLERVGEPLPGVSEYDLKKIIVDAGLRNRKELDAARRGVVTFRETETGARELLAGDMQWFHGWKPGVAWNDAQLTAARHMLNAAGSETVAARERLNRATPETMDKLSAEYQAKLTIFDQVHKRVEAAAAESGRGLSALRILSRASETYAALFEHLEGKGKPAIAPDAWDMLFEVWQNLGLLSGPLTHIRNIAGNTSMLAAKPLRTLIASAVDTVESVLTGKPREIWPGEAYREVVAIGKAVPEAWTALKRAWGEEHVGTESKIEEYRQGRGPAIPGKAGRFVRAFGYRPLGAMDAFGKVLLRDSEIAKLAYRQATGEGLTGGARDARMAKLIVEANAKFNDLWQAGHEAALYGSFQRPLGPTGRALTKVFSGKLLRYIVPFKVTPANIAKITLEHTVFNAARLSWKYRKGELTKTQFAEEVAKPILGTAVQFAVLALAQAGYITGSGPKDKNEREALYRTGWQPYSIKVGDQYISYDFLEPAGSIMALAADALEASKGESKNRASKMFFSAFKNIGSKTYLGGISKALDAMRDPDRYGQQFVQGYAGSLVPSIVAQTARVLDPVIREKDTALDAIQERIPGLREKLLPRRDLWGNEVAKTETMAERAVSPFKRSTVKQDTVEDEVQRLNIDRGLPGEQFTYNGKKIKLTPEEYDAFVVNSGQRAHKLVADAIASSEYQRASDEVKAKHILKLISLARDIEKNKMLAVLRQRAKEAS